jgi:oligopeptidase B
MIPHREDVMLEDIDLFARHAVVHERVGGFPRMRVMSFATGQEHEIEMPEPVYSRSEPAMRSSIPMCFASATNRW